MVKFCMYEDWIIWLPYRREFKRNQSVRYDSKHHSWRLQRNVLATEKCLDRDRQNRLWYPWTVQSPLRIVCNFVHTPRCSAQCNGACAAEFSLVRYFVTERMNQILSGGGGQTLLHSTSYQGPFSYWDGDENEGLSERYNFSCHLCPNMTKEPEDEAVIHLFTEEISMIECAGTLKHECIYSKNPIDPHPIKPPL